MAGYYDNKLILTWESSYYEGRTCHILFAKFIAKEASIERMVTLKNASIFSKISFDWSILENIKWHELVDPGPLFYKLEKPFWRWRWPLWVENLLLDIHFLSQTLTTFTLLQIVIDVWATAGNPKIMNSHPVATSLETFLWIVSDFKNPI